MKSLAQKTSEADVVARLAAGTFSAPAFALLRGVRNATGYSRRARTADALAVSLWPSRGVYFAGVEVKVDRSDWLRELRDPEKSDEIQRFCSYWWIATPPDIVRAGELPETWGHIEVTAKCKVLKQAPKLDAQPLSPEFVAAILRNAAENQQQHVANAAWKAREEQRALASPERAEELQRKLTESQCLIDGLKRQLERAKEPEQRLTEVVRNFEREVGLPEGTVINEHRWYLDESVRNGRLWRAAQLLADGDVEKLRLKLQAAADALGALRQEVAAE